MPLPYLPSSLLKETADWGFASTVQSSMGSLLRQGQELMQPVREQVTEVVREALPAPAAPPAPAPMALPEVKPFTLPSLESWGMHAPEPPRAQPQPIDLTPTPQAPPGPAQTPSAGFLGAGGFSLPSLESWGIGSGARPGTPTPAPGGMGAPLPGAAAAPTARAPTDVNAYLEHAARKAGIDPAQVLAVMGKEGPTGWGSVGTFDTGTSYGPLQLHYAGGSNPKQGMGDRFTKATGIDLRKDGSVEAHQAAVDFAMGELAKRGDWSEWYGADNAFPAASGEQGRFTKVNRVQPTPAEAPAASAAPRPGTYTKDLVPNQITEGAAQGLTTEEALAVCGPAAAVAFARANGRNPSLREAKELAQNLGLWDVGAGMHGPASQVQLLQKMGVQARLQEGTDWTRVAQEVQAGRPVILDSPQHYYVVSGFDERTGEYELGQSAGVLRKSGGKTRWRPDQIPSLGMGDIRATIYLEPGR